MKQLWIILFCAIGLAPLELAAKTKREQSRLEQALPLLKCLGLCLLIGFGMQSFVPQAWTCPVCLGEFPSKRRLVQVCRNNHPDLLCVPCARQLLAQDSRCPQCRENFDTTRVQREITAKNQE